ncbi:MULTISPECIES: hypothetical protein [unclassified Streptomyces]|uniref:hypothetical protein n=1 Tax=unclassified Streptomyces TaxID=2593676 RepID=UPI00344C31D7
MPRTICPTNIMGHARRPTTPRTRAEELLGTDANDFALHWENPITDPASAWAGVTARWWVTAESRRLWVAASWVDPFSTLPSAAIARRGPALSPAASRRPAW